MSCQWSSGPCTLATTCARPSYTCSSSTCSSSRSPPAPCAAASHCQRCMMKECISRTDGEVQKPSITASLHVTAHWLSSCTICMLRVQECLPVDRHCQLCTLLTLLQIHHEQCSRGCMSKELLQQKLQVGIVSVAFARGL